MWLKEILRIFLAEQLLIKYYVIKHLILRKIRNMMGIKEALLQCSINFLIKKFLIKEKEFWESTISWRITQTNDWKIKKTENVLIFKDNIWEADLADMQLISKYNKEIRFYYALLIFTVNMYRLFLWQTFQKILG